MILIVLTVVVVGLLIGVLAIFLFMIGVLLNRIADNLDDCLQNVKKIAVQAEVIIPDVARINQTGGVVAGALPLLVGGAEAVTAKLVPPKTTPKAPEAPKAPLNAASAAVPTGVGYLDS
jgi:hypothetical protein